MTDRELQRTLAVRGGRYAKTRGGGERDVGGGGGGAGGVHPHETFGTLNPSQNLMREGLAGDYSVDGRGRELRCLNREGKVRHRWKQEGLARREGEVINS